MINERPYKRTDRVALQILQILGEITTKHIDISYLGFVTFTRVDVSPDLRHSKVYYSVMNGKMSNTAINDELNKMSTDNKLKDKRAEIFRLIQLFKPKVDNQWLIQDLRSLKFQYASGKISDQELLDEVTDLTTSTAKFLLKRQEQGIEEEPEIPQVLYSKYLKAT